MCKNKFVCKKIRVQNLAGFSGERRGQIKGRKFDKYLDKVGHRRQQVDSGFCGLFVLFGLV